MLRRFNWPTLVTMSMAMELSVELWREVLEILSDMYGLGSLLGFSTSCKYFHTLTLPLLYQNVVLERFLDSDTQVAVPPHTTPSSLLQSLAYCRVLTVQDEPSQSFGRRMHLDLRKVLPTLKGLRELRSVGHPSRGRIMLNLP